MGDRYAKIIATGAFSGSMNITFSTFNVLFIYLQMVVIEDILQYFTCDKRVGKVGKLYRSLPCAVFRLLHYWRTNNP